VLTRGLIAVLIVVAVVA